jgi:hypothetical protein
LPNSSAAFSLTAFASPTPRMRASSATSSRISPESPPCSASSRCATAVTVSPTMPVFRMIATSSPSESACAPRSFSFSRGRSSGAHSRSISR